MKVAFRSVAYFCVAGFLSASPAFSQQARVTQVVREVKLLPANAASTARAKAPGPSAIRQCGSAATSGIGVAAIQMAKAAGARVIATGRGADKAEQALAIGADIAVDTLTQDFGAIAKQAGGVDVALDMVGAPYFDATLDALNTGGRIVYIASQGGSLLQVPIRVLMKKRALITGSTLRPRTDDEKARLAVEIERVVWPWIRAGLLKPVVDRIFPLDQAAQAHAWIEQGRHTGKVVLRTIDSDVSGLAGAPE